MKQKKELSAKQRMMIRIKKRKQWPCRMYIYISCIIFCGMVLVGKLQGVCCAEAPESFGSETVKSRITIAGDVQVTDHVRKLANNIGYKQLFEGVSTYWENSDCVMVNVSGPVLRTDVDNYKSTREKDEDSNYLRPAAVRGFQAAGIDLLSFANDDAYNYGITGISTTMEVMKENQMDYIGIASNLNEVIYRTVEYKVPTPLGAMDNRQISIVSVNDDIRDKSTVGTSKAGIINSSVNTLYTSIFEVSQQSVYTVAYVHFDDGENTKVTENQRTVAHAMIDAGADLVVGSNDSLNSVEEYHGGLIVYGLGRFISDEFYSTSLDGAMLDLIVDENEQVYVYLTPTRIKDGQPTVTQSKLYKKRIHSTLLSELEKESYTVDENGVICIPR